MNVGTHPWLAHRPIQLETGPFPWVEGEWTLLPPPRVSLAVLGDEYYPELSEDTIQQWLELDSSPSSPLYILFAHALEVYAYLLQVTIGVVESVLPKDPVNDPILCLVGETAAEYTRRVRARRDRERIRGIIDQTLRQIARANEIADRILEDFPRSGIALGLPDVNPILRALDSTDLANLIDDELHLGSIFFDDLWIATRLFSNNFEDDAHAALQPFDFIIWTLQAMMYLLANPNIVFGPPARLRRLSQVEIDALHPYLSFEEADERVLNWLNTFWVHVSHSLSFIKPN